MYYLKENITVEEKETRVQNGTLFRVYVTGTEDGVRKLIRISGPDRKVIAAANEDFEDEAASQKSGTPLSLPPNIYMVAFCTKTS